MSSPLNVPYVRLPTYQGRGREPIISAASEHGPYNEWLLPVHAGDAIGWWMSTGLLFVDCKDVQRGPGLQAADDP